MEELFVLLRLFYLKLFSLLLFQMYVFYPGVAVLVTDLVYWNWISVQ